MKKDVVVWFSGQGAQKVGMGQDLAQEFPAVCSLLGKADEVFASGLGELGMGSGSGQKSLSEVMFGGPDEELTRTLFCQPALFVHGLACLEAISQFVPGLNILGGAGLSLGELTAHTACGTFSFEEGLRLVQKRGFFMEEACRINPGTMAAMIGGEQKAVEDLAEECEIQVANYNCPGQLVVSGTISGVEKAVELAKSRGIKLAKKLNVAGAYHSRLMNPAGEKFREAIQLVPIAKPLHPVTCNFSVKEVSDADEIRESLINQITSSVRWTETMQKYVAAGATTFLELGPGKVLAGLMARVSKDITVLSIEDVPSLQEAVEKLNAR